MTSTPQPSSPGELVVGGKPMSVADAAAVVRGSANWFWWVAGLSLVNSIAVMLDLQYGMMLGLGLTQVADAVFFYSPEGDALDLGTVARLVHLAVVVGIAGVFVLFGVFARRGSSAAFVAGMLLYAADALLFVLASDWIALGFHGFVLFMLWSGYSVLRVMNAARPSLAAA